MQNDKEQGIKCMTWTRKTGKTYRQGSDENPLESVVVCKCKRWGAEMCPFHELGKLTQYKQRAGISTEPDQPFLVRKGKTGKIIPYNAYTAGALLKRLAKAAGLTGKTCKETVYTLHGFRKGGAIQAVQDGLPTSTIMKQADWKTARMVAYYNRQIPTEMHATNMTNKYQ